MNRVHTDFFYCGAVKLNANRSVVGVLRGFDQFMNLVLDATVEMVGEEKNEIGMVVRPSAHVSQFPCVYVGDNPTLRFGESTWACKTLTVNPVLALV